jgi:uncharacterized protein (TIGR02145 family)
VPRIESNKFLARVTAKAASNQSYCSNNDVTLCGKTWMGCNLDVDTYRDGTQIPEVQDSLVWGKLTSGAWCYYNNDPEMGAIYGKLYNWYAVNDPRGLAPIGWHVPNNTEWTDLENCMITSAVAGGKLKSKGTIEEGTGKWYSPNTGATNESGFTAIPGGYRVIIYYNNGYGGYWWSSLEESTTTYAWIRCLVSSEAVIIKTFIDKNVGMSVRCVRD